jgi:outer membrane protein assembly factor BamB
LLAEVKGAPLDGDRSGVTFEDWRNRSAFADARKRDIFHLNSVKVLTRQLAPKFPMFKPGQVLVSMCHLDTIAVLDIDSGKLVWAARGPWEFQHDPQFLDNGRLLLFDNLGSPTESRVLEYDPTTQAFPWSYSGENAKPFLSKLRGMSQRLPNGNTLIVNSDAGKILEVTRDKELVWSCSTGGFTTSGRRFRPEQLPFLEGGQRARP